MHFKALFLANTPTWPNSSQQVQQIEKVVQKKLHHVVNCIHVSSYKATRSLRNKLASLPEQHLLGSVVVRAQRQGHGYTTLSKSLHVCSDRPIAVLSKTSQDQSKCQRHVCWSRDEFPQALSRSTTNLRSHALRTHHKQSTRSERVKQKEPLYHHSNFG